MTYTLYFTQSGSIYLINPIGEVIARLHDDRFIDLRNANKKFKVSNIVLNNQFQEVKDPHNLPKTSQIFLGKLSEVKPIFEEFISFLKQKNLSAPETLEEFIAEASYHCTSPIVSKLELKESEVRNYIQNYKSN